MLLSFLFVFILCFVFTWLNCGVVLIYLPLSPIWGQISVFRGMESEMFNSSCPAFYMRLRWSADFQVSELSG